MTQMRTHTCNELRLENAGEKVTIVGWLENVRVVSSALAFAVIRDFYGTTQAVAETEEMVNGPGAGQQKPQTAHRGHRDRPGGGGGPGPLPLQ